ncbi:MAG: hypothetical protein U9O65_10350 [Thermotogota bacterium]|nr:hypothetical protein [Thermotogota bacterium]
MPEEKFCMRCGAKIPAEAEICPVCKAKQPSLDARLEEDIDKCLYSVIMGYNIRIYAYDLIGRVK